MLELLHCMRTCVVNDSFQALDNLDLQCCSGNVCLPSFTSLRKMVTQINAVSPHCNGRFKRLATAREV